MGGARMGYAIYDKSVLNMVHPFNPYNPWLKTPEFSTKCLSREFAIAALLTAVFCPGGVFLP